MEPSSAPWRAIESPGADAPQEPEPPARSTAWLAIGAVALVVALGAAVFLLATRAEHQDITIEGEAHAGGSTVAGDASVAGGTPGEVVVEVGGAVARPGVYHLRAGARVGDAIAAAGGFDGQVDAAAADRALNLAAEVHDGDEVHVPRRGDGPAGGGSGGAVASGGAAGSLVDLNHATAQELDTLPGVGPATAEKIIAAREEQPFASVDDLRTRKVVGQATLEKLRPLATALP